MISKRKLRTAVWLLVALFPLLTGGCSTKKNTLVRRTYHNITAHYNVYWNGMDNLRQGLKEYQAGLKDNYALVLPVYNYGDKAAASKMSQYADIAIKKASKAINKHSMVFNRKEYNRWIDDSYLLIGKSYFYKQDYSMARRTFEFVIKTYNDSDIKYEAMLWQARANIEIGDFNRAESMLDMVQAKISKGDAPLKYETELNLVYAHLQIRQKSYDAAVPYLNRALELKTTSAMRTRCHYILGQIYQQSGDFAQASFHFDYAVKHAKSYDMEFNAKISLAQCYDAGSGNREYIVGKLMKMLKDSKNQDYQDQIYYALAHIAMKDADSAVAIDYYRKSVSTSTTNNYQKAISSLELADIFFNVRDYMTAQAYYDSTMQFLPKDYPGYKELSKRTQTLTDLVKNLHVVQRQDSLQRLAAMPEAQRLRIIDQIIAKIVEEEMKKQMEEQQRLQNQMLYAQTGGQGMDPSGGSKEGRWYFYNPTALSNGFSNFLRKWGQRKLEDNWFLSDKALAVFTPESEETDSSYLEGGDTLKGGKKGGKSTNPKDRAFYLPDIPLSPEKIEASNEKIIEALYQAGFIFAEGLADYANAAKTFEDLLRRFPDCKYKVQSVYELCILYEYLQNQPESDRYRTQVLTQYPETDYAKLLVNPNFYKEIAARQSEASKLYNDTYRAFTNQQYYMVINNADLARGKFQGDTALMPKFDYLRALALGKIEVVDSLVVSMQKLVADYPRSQVRPLAENVLAMLGTGGGTQAQPVPSEPGAAAPVPSQASLYKYDPEAVHFYVLVVNDDLVDVEALKIKITDYNAKFHDLQKLMVNSLMLDDSRQMITVNNFDNSRTAITYFMGILTSKYIFTKLENAGEYQNFVISVENYPILYKNKDVPLYLRFFEQNYPEVQ